MSNFSTAIIFIIILDLVLVICGAAITNINPDGRICINTKDSMLSDFETQTQFTNDASTILPNSNSAVNANPGNFVTDLTNMIISGLKSIPILNKALTIVNAPFQILSCTLVLPQEFINLVSGAWWLISTIIIFAWAVWRD